MENQTKINETEEKTQKLKEEQKFNYPRSTVEMLEQTLQIA